MIVLSFSNTSYDCTYLFAKLWLCNRAKVVLIWLSHRLASVSTFNRTQVRNYPIRSRVHCPDIPHRTDMHGHVAESGTYLIVPFWYSSAAYRAVLISSCLGIWLDHISSKYEPYVLCHVGFLPVLNGQLIWFRISDNVARKRLTEAKYRGLGTRQIRTMARPPKCTKKVRFGLNSTTIQPQYHAKQYKRLKKCVFTSRFEAKLLQKWHE